MSYIDLIKSKLNSPEKRKTLTEYLQEQENALHLEELRNKLSPRKGIDYFTQEEEENFLKQITPVKGIHYKDGKDGQDGKMGRNGKDGKDGKDGRNGKDGKVDEEKLVGKLTNIIQEELKKAGVNKEAIAKYGPFRLRHGGGDLMQAFDLSSQLNSSLKTFTIPQNRKIVQITSSSTPFVFRPTIDYSVSGSGNRTLTFAAGIDATSMLAAGQSIMVIYVQ